MPDFPLSNQLPNSILPYTYESCHVPTTISPPVQQPIFWTTDL